MTPLAKVILVALLSLRVCWLDRVDPRKHDQLETVAVAVAQVTNASRWRGDRLDFAAALVAIGYHESRYSLAVHEGRCNRAWCPALGIWQLETDKHGEQGPLVGLGLVETTRSARAAGWMLSHSRQCGNSPRAWFTAYSGRACDTLWPTLEERVATFRRVRTVMGTELAKQLREAA